MKKSLHPIHLLFGFHGRINHREWWLGNLVMWGLMAIIGVIEWKLDIHPFLWGMILSIILLWMRMAVNLKRFHDAGKSAWWLLWEVIPVLGGVICFVCCAAFDQHPHENKYGEKHA